MIGPVTRQGEGTAEVVGMDESTDRSSKKHVVFVALYLRTIFHCNDSGWMDNNGFNVWLCHFISIVKPKLDDRVSTSATG